MKKILASALLFIMITAQAQVSTNFGKEIEALIKAEAPDLMMNQVKSENATTFYRTNLQIEDFEVNYIVSAITGNVLYAKYLKKGNDEVMDSIYNQLNTIPYLIFDSKSHPELIRKNNTNLIRKINVKSRENAKTVLIITLENTDEINLEFLRN